MNQKIFFVLLITLLFTSFNINAQCKNSAYLKEIVANSTLMRDLDTTWYPNVDSNIYDEIINENGQVTLVKTGTKKVNMTDMSHLPIKNVYLVDTSNFFYLGTKCLIGKINVHIVKTAPKNKRILYNNIFMLHHGIKNDDHIFLLLNKPTNRYEQFYFNKNGPAKIRQFKTGQF